MLSPLIQNKDEMNDYESWVPLARHCKRLLVYVKGCLFCQRHEPLEHVQAIDFHAIVKN
jgi:hypothetical protein